MIFPFLRCLHLSKKLAEKNGFFDNLFGTRVEKATNAHSVLLADQQLLYDLQRKFNAHDLKLWLKIISYFQSSSQC